MGRNRKFSLPEVERAFTDVYADSVKEYVIGKLHGVPGGCGSEFWEDLERKLEGMKLASRA